MLDAYFKGPAVLTPPARRSRTTYGADGTTCARSAGVAQWEAALRALICPPSVLAAQLDRLVGVIGMDTVSLGNVPFDASLKIPPADGFWILDDRLAITEDWHAELWLDDTDN
jgi:uncharacterized protein DUF5753